MIIDGRDLILGRLASFTAKKALLGETIDIVNCEEVAISGNRRATIGDYMRKKSMGSIRKGPYFYKNPDMFVRRTIRGMLPYKLPKGREAFKRIKCYVGVPENLKGKLETIKEAHVDKLPDYNYIKVKEICKEMGWQK